MSDKLIAKKSLGQHFLRSEKAIMQIINSIKDKNLPVFEIGPGEGVLTQKLLEARYTVIAIEIDERSIEILNEDFREYIQSGQLRILPKSCLEVDYSEQLNEDFTLVGNIPYYITGAIFRHTFEQTVLPKQAIFLVQKEVAQRVVAKVNNKDNKESILSVSIKVFVKNTPDPSLIKRGESADVEIVDIVKAGSFAPPPKVDSAILNIENIINPFKNKTQYDLFFSILKAAFSQKRKFLMSNLKSKLDTEFYTKYLSIFNKIFIEKYGEKVRAEDVNILDWKNLIKLLKN